jgi:energy-coupling factor transport system permease protein
VIKDITFGQYIPGESVLHKADPRTKILMTFIYMLAILFVRTYTGFAMFALFTLLVSYSANIPLKYTIKGLKPILMIVVFTAVINIFTIHGTPVMNSGPLKYISWEGLDISFKMAIRLSLLIMSASLMTLTTTPIHLTDGMEKLMKPLGYIGVPVHEIAMMMSIALRFIPTLLDETDKIMKAQSSRGADFDSGNILQRAKSFVPVLVPLFISAFRRADELATAMEVRCYRGSEGRTRMKQLRFSRADLMILLIMTAFIGFNIYVQWFALM